jgi:TonB-linked SusC/RagA family outer membrane protein
MKKNVLQLVNVLKYHELTHFIRIMRMTFFLIFVVVFQMVATNTEAQNTKINISKSTLSLRELIAEIEKQTDYLFVFNDSEINLSEKVIIDARNKSVNDVLKQVFGDSPIVYEFANNYISLRTLDQSEKTAILQQQKNTIRGTVVDEIGEPVIGANVVEKGTTNGVITDIDGKFSLNVQRDAVLQISYIGYVGQEVAVRNRQVFQIVMKEDLKALDEVVVVGYGTLRRRDLTGSVSSVSGSQLKDIPVASAAQAITGKMPGVQVTQTEGSPDAEIKIRVRGGGSITQDNSPLFIVDGFPVDNINDLAPTDIAFIDILKDASSTAIYGARGANGVVIITTKEGFEGKAKITYNTYFGIKNIAKTMDVLDPYEFVLWQFETQSVAAASAIFGDYGDIDLYKSMKATDWQDKVFGRTGYSIYDNLTVAGGTKAAKYNISLTRNDEKEIMLGSGYDRTNLSVKTTYDVKNWLTLELNTRISNTNLKGAGTGMTSVNGETSSRLTHVIQYRPVDGISEFVDPSLVDPGDYGGASQYVMNPLQQTQDDYRRNNSLLLNVNAAAVFKIMKGLTYRFEFGQQSTKGINKRFFGLHTADVWNYKQPMAEIRNENASRYRMANVITYNRRNILPGNNITLMLGEEIVYSKSERSQASAKMFPKYIDPEGALSMMSLGIPDPIITFNNPANKTSSFFGRLNYDYKGRYLASLVMRVDGSSKFARGNRWGYFPSASVAWRVSDEAFMKPVADDWLSNLKLRLSYGQSGNNRIGDDAWKKTFSVQTSKLYAEGSEDTPSSFLAVSGELSNPRLKWETTVTRNVGLDFGFFNQRLSGTVELYKNTTKDLLIKASIPPSSGYNSQWRNIGQTSNRGIEIGLEAILVDNKDLTLSASFNIGFNKNKIDNLGDGTGWEETSAWLGTASGPSGDYLVEVGKPVGLMYGYQTVGMYSFDDFNYDAANGIYTLKEGVSDNKSLVTPRQFWPGTLKLADQDGNLVVDAADKVIIGDANPKHTGGFNLTAQYKGIDFSAFFNWVYGNDVYNANKLYFTSYNGARPHKNMLSFMNSGNTFTYLDKLTGIIVSDPEQLKDMNGNATLWSASMTSTPLHSWGVEDGSFLRLNNVTLGYSLPKTLLSKIKIEQLRVYVTGYNLWIWTNYSGFDPEVDTRRVTPVTPSVDWCAYPRSRSYNVGLNITF